MGAVSVGIIGGPGINQRPTLPRHDAPRNIEPSREDIDLPSIAIDVNEPRADGPNPPSPSNDLSIENAS